MALEGVGITAPFPIQSLALPVALGGHDIIGQARTADSLRCRCPTRSSSRPGVPTTMSTPARSASICGS